MLIDYLLYRLARYENDGSILPSNSTSAEYALEQSTAKAYVHELKNRSIWNPDTCPAELLPWLAWSLSVDTWNDNWSEQEKRNIIKNSFAYHKTKGTIGALKTALESLGYTITIIEWYQNGGEPYTFSLNVNTGGQSFTADSMADIEKIIQNNKNVRSHLTNITISVNVDGIFHTASICTAADITTVETSL
jgi:phage tail P2-like protein